MVQRCTATVCVFFLFLQLVFLAVYFQGIEAALDRAVTSEGTIRNHEYAFSYFCQVLKWHRNYGRKMAAAIIEFVHIKKEKNKEESTIFYDWLVDCVCMFWEYQWERSRSFDLEPKRCSSCSPHYLQSKINFCDFRNFRLWFLLRYVVSRT